jgi:polysaccharide pyruvyl transferase WcaK-like protein
MECIMKKVAVQGALNVDNFGDVLLGRIYTDWLSESGSEVLAPKAIDSVLSEMPNANKGAFSEADALVYIGGGYFGEPPRSFLGKYRWGFRMIRYHLSASLDFLTKPKKIAITGVGIGPVTNFIAWLGVVAISRKAKLIVVRDEQSRDYLSSHWGSKNVSVSPDVALTLSRDKFSTEMNDAATQLSERFESKPVIGIHFDKQAASEEQWELLWLETVNWLNNEDYQVLLLVDQKNTPVLNAQLKEYELYSQQLANASIYTYESVDHLVGTLSECSAILTTKLHVAIVGTALGVPAYSFACHTKIKRFYDQLEMSELCLPMGQWGKESLKLFFSRVSRKEMPNKDKLLEKKKQAQAGLDKLRQFVKDL